MGLRLEFVAETAHGEDPTWFRGIILQLLAKMPDVNVNRTITTDITAIAPNRFDQCASAERSIGMINAKGLHSNRIKNVVYR
jgi:hypothetical protein